MNVAMDRIAELHTIFDSSVQNDETTEPENAAEIGQAI
jgi:hypothetical protein